MTARDVRYGRRGGRWADGDAGSLDEVLDAFAAARRSAGDRWPKPQDRTAHLRPTSNEGWQGLARMALARRAAGLDLAPLDLEALDMYPDPPSGVLGPIPARCAA